MIDNLDRLSAYEMEHYRNVYKKSKRWDGTQHLKDKTIVVYCEQGIGDIIQFARYLPFLRRHTTKIILHAPKELHRLLMSTGKIQSVFDKESTVLPKHDYHVLSMSLPFLLDKNKAELKSYIHVPESEDLSEFKDFIKIGIAWEGNPQNTTNLERSCHLKHFRNLSTDKTKLFMLNKEPILPDLVDEELELYSTDKEDFYDTAKLINSLDLVVTVDTACLHLAGAMGKKTIGLLCYNHDSRWNGSNWYESVTLIKQKSPGDWDSVFSDMQYILNGNK